MASQCVCDCGCADEGDIVSFNWYEARKQMARNPKFERLLENMLALHAKKNNDYAKDSNPYSNFEEAAAFAGCSVDTVFRVLIGIKAARLKELLDSGKDAQNESVQDSRMDLTMYAALWCSYSQ